MKKLLFLDTETTGNEEKDYLCQVAYGVGEMPNFVVPKNEVVSNLFKPRIPISVESSAVHHITNKMVEDKPEFKWSEDKTVLHKLLEDPNTIFVAHNAKFDIKMLEKEELEVPNFICTLRVARYLDKENKIPRYNLQYLRYYLGIEIDATAHDAKGDVLVMQQLFARLYKKMLEENGDDEEKALTLMMEISKKPSLINSFSFGKHKGKTVEEVAKSAPDYLDWLLAQKLENDPDDEDWIHTLRHHLGKLDF